MAGERKRRWWHRRFHVTPVLSGAHVVVPLWDVPVVDVPDDERPLWEAQLQVPPAPTVAGEARHGG